MSRFLARMSPFVLALLLACLLPETAAAQTHHARPTEPTEPAGEMSQKERIALCRDRLLNGNPNPVTEEEAKRTGGPVTRPQIIAQTRPEYTVEARKARLQGTVILEVMIDREGCIQQARVLKGLPMGLDQAALDAVKQWVFLPARLDSKPVAVFYVLTTSFQLMDADARW
jgi:TonB family protein